MRLLFGFAPVLIMVSAPAVRAADPAVCLVEAARRQVGVTVRYDSRYTRIQYPGGDVPLDRGVCTDVLVRAYRNLGVDLQQLVHEDMRRAWAVYPKQWRLPGPDSNIDHRRVPNLAKFFSRHAQTLPAATNAAAYQPGDIVTWRLPLGATHIGLVSGRRSEGGVPLVIHNIGDGAKEEDTLFSFTITGHYRYFPENLIRRNAPTCDSLR